jgi:hypothetical protein
MEEREFRIYASAYGEEPVIRDLLDVKLLAYWIKALRQIWPESTISVRETTETVRAVYTPDGNAHFFGNEKDIRDLPLTAD